MAVEEETLERNEVDSRRQEQREEDSVPSSIEKANNGLLDYEAKRRNHLFYAVYAIGLVIVVLYALLIKWVLCHGSEPSAWHTTILLMLAPTTLSIFVLKLLSKPESVANKDNSEENIATINLLSKSVEKLADLLDKIKTS